MTRFILSKAAGMLAVLAIVAVLVFVLTRAASGDPVAVLLGDRATAADIARVQKQYGLDQPLPTQFVIWLREVLHGNLGDSIFLRRPVTQALAERAEPTTLLTLLAVALATLIGVPCGIVSAVYRRRAADQGVSGLAMLGASVPSFWLGIVLIRSSRSRWVGSRCRATAGPGAPCRAPALLLPAIAGAAPPALIRFARASMLDVLGEDYVRTARQGPD
jgi:peptide/nickel transport system permease protein